MPVSSTVATSRRWWALILHASLGAIGGYTLLHPLSMVVHGFAGASGSSFADVFRISTAWDHLPMAGYFSLIGASVGAVYGVLNVRLKRQNDRLRELSVTDELTSLFNRRYFFEQIDREISRAARSGTTPSVMIVDIDHFKGINDEHGHQVGDAVLSAVAGQLKATARVTDVVARYGGEEFVVLMPATEHAAARRLAERVRENLETMREGHTKPLTVSIGVATHAADMGAAVLIKEADRALYEAKRNGRNQVQSQPPPPRDD